MAEPELIEMLAAESDRRIPTITESLEKLANSSEPDCAGVEELRVEVHGLKGAAMLIGQSRLAELAERTEKAIAARTEAGTIDPELAERLTSAIDAFHGGAQAAAKGDPEPASIAEALGALF